jgi:hypothetical protein
VVNHGEQKLQPVFVQDVARAVLGSIQYEDATGQTFELGGPDIYTFKNIVRLVNHSGLLNVRVMNLPDPIARVYGRLLGGTRIQVDESSSKWKRGLAAIANHVRMNGIFYEDRVNQGYVDLVCDPSYPGLTDLGVTPTNLLNVIDSLMMTRRDDDIAPDRFPDAEKLKEQARDYSSLRR